jgi:hypothetical protein
MGRYLDDRTALRSRLEAQMAGSRRRPVFAAAESRAWRDVISRMQHDPLPPRVRM